MGCPFGSRSVGSTEPPSLSLPAPPRGRAGPRSRQRCSRNPRASRSMSRKPSHRRPRSADRPRSVSRRSCARGSEPPASWHDSCSALRQSSAAPLSSRRFGWRAVEAKRRPSPGSRSSSGAGSSSRSLPIGGGDVRHDFSHGRLRDVAYESIGLPRRRLLHRRVADALRSATAPGDEAARWSLIAHHEALAGRSSEAAVAHRLAGEHARAVFANREAREHFEAAIALGDPNVVGLHESLADVLTLLGDYAGAIAHFEVAAALAEPDRRPAIEHHLGLVHARRGDWARAAGYLDGALESVGDDAPATRSALLADRSAIAHRAGDATSAGDLASQALDLGAAAGDLRCVARAEDLLGILARGSGDLLAARQHLERSATRPPRAPIPDRRSPRSTAWPSSTPTWASGTVRSSSPGRLSFSASDKEIATARRLWRTISPISSGPRAVRTRRWST